MNQSRITRSKKCPVPLYPPQGDASVNISTVAVKDEEDISTRFVLRVLNDDLFLLYIISS